MLVRWRINERCELELNPASPKDLVKELAAYQEVLIDRKCGACGAETIKHEHRVHDGNDFYSLRCLACGAQLDYGQHKTGQTLFAKRDKGNHGWYKYDRSENQ